MTLPPWIQHLMTLILKKCSILQCYPGGSKPQGLQVSFVKIPQKSPEPQIGCIFFAQLLARICPLLFDDRHSHVQMAHSVT